jgi:hypothetical protein
VRCLLLVPVIWFGGVLGVGAAPGEPKQPETVTDGIGYRMVQAPGSAIPFPRLTQYRDRSILRRVNREIGQWVETMTCGEDVEENDYEVRSEVTYAAKDIFSIYASASYYCGGHYPTNDSNMSATFDLKTGKVVNFPDLFRDYEADKKDILKTIFAEQIARAEQAAMRPGKQEERSDGEASCEDVPDLFSLEHLAQSDFAFNFAREGLQVQPEWPHAIEACALRVTAPYATLKKFARPDGILARVGIP